MYYLELVELVDAVVCLELDLLEPVDLIELLEEVGCTELELGDDACTEVRLLKEEECTELLEDGCIELLEEECTELLGDGQMSELDDALLELDLVEVGQTSELDDDLLELELIEDDGCPELEEILLVWELDCTDDERWLLDGVAEDVVGCWLLVSDVERTDECRLLE